MRSSDDYPLSWNGRGESHLQQPQAARTLSITEGPCPVPPPLRPALGPLCVATRGAKNANPSICNCWDHRPSPFGHLPLAALPVAWRYGKMFGRPARDPQRHRTAGRGFSEANGSDRPRRRRTPPAPTSFVHAEGRAASIARQRRYAQGMSRASLPPGPRVCAPELQSGAWGRVWKKD